MPHGHDDDFKGEPSSPPCRAHEADPAYMWAGLDVRLKRVYDAAEAGDGTRVLVDRVWPRGLRKVDSVIDLWLKDVAPSTELRRWFAHDPDKWPEFRRCYRAELAEKADVMTPLERAARQSRVTLLFAARDRERNHAIVLRDWLLDRPEP